MTTILQAVAIISSVLQCSDLLAETSPVPSIILVDWGIFAAHVKSAIAAPDTSSGVTEVSTDATLIEETRDVCATLGVQFGFRYRLSGSVPIARLPLTIHIEHPSFSKWNGGTSSVDTMQTSIYAGQLHWTGWAFRDPTKLIAGIWHFSVMSKGTVVIEQRFQVKTGCISPVS